MKDQTLITMTGMVLVAGFGAVAVAVGYDGLVTGTVIFVLATAMGIAIPRPTFLKE